MKELIKKIYFLLASPLENRLRSEFVAALGSEQARLSLEFAKLEARISELSRVAEGQSAYLERLRAAGLNEVLARSTESDQHESSPILLAVADVLGGMEASVASAKHGIPTDTLLRSVRRLQFQRVSNEPLAAAETKDTATKDYTALLEEQLIYNAKQANDRESVLDLECTRLRRELELVKFSAKQT
ncbi:MAG TPA: hypothetical protein V6C97_08895 [Oculatellaceae cyanobacterium]